MTAEAKLETTARWFENWKVIATAVAAVLAAIFTAGIAVEKLSIEVQQRLSTIEQNGGDIKGLQGSVTQLLTWQKSLSKWSPTSSEAAGTGESGGSKNPVPTMCQDGFYAVGVSVEQHKDGGDLMGVHVICRPLPVAAAQ